jgi:glycosyltransferase involved in cell wall biosynthesis
MKASFLLTTYNKNTYLPNVLYSIAQQKTSFPLDICILDDFTAEDPVDIVKQFLPDAKYKRLEKRAGTHHSTPECFKMADADSDIIILMSADVVICQPFVIEELCKGVGSKKVAIAEVKDRAIAPDFYKNFNENVEAAFKDWDKYKSYSGTNRGGFWLFLAAIMKEDFLEVKIDKVNCDRINTTMMKRNKYTAYYMDELKGIHQKHGWSRHACTRANCEFTASCGAKLLK